VDEVDYADFNGIALGSKSSDPRAKKNKLNLKVHTNNSYDS
jgi:hypothetical protein